MNRRRSTSAGSNAAIPGAREGCDAPRRAVRVGLGLYAVSFTPSQRLEVTAGKFSQTTMTYELHRLGQAVITRPFFLRLVGTGNVILGGGVVLQGIRKPEVVRDMRRDLGQVEALAHRQNSLALN